MKVVFKLSPDQFKRASEQQALLAVRLCMKGDKLMRGNLLLPVPCVQHPNPSQQLTLDVDQETMTYEGHRAPFLNDGALKTVLYVMGAQSPEQVDPSSLLCYEYHDPDLNWWDPLVSFLEQEVLAGVLRPTDFLIDADVIPPWVFKTAYLALIKKAFVPPSNASLSAYLEWHINASPKDRCESIAMNKLNDMASERRMVS